MALIEMNSHWQPVGRHGTVTYKEGSNVQDAVEAAAKLFPRKSRTGYKDIQYFIHRNLDGTQVLVFELVD